MAWLFLFFTALAISHFVYEGIIAPSIRLKCRYDLFALRDKLRRLKSENPDKLSDEVFQLMESTLNNAITLLHHVDLVVIRQANRAVLSDARLAQQIEKRLSIIENCPLREIELIHYQSSRVIVKALVVNQGGWIIYTSPIALIAWIAVKFITTVRSFVSKRLLTPIKEIIVMPEQELEQTASPYHPVFG